MVGLLLPAIARADSTWVDHYRAALAAHRAGDLAAFQDQLRMVQGVLGDQPGVNYNLACAAARLGNRDEALRRLGLYAASGMARDVAADSDFVALWNDPAFVSVAARIRANGDSIGSARLIHRFGAADLLTEDVAWDPVTRRHYCSSVHHGGVVEVGRDGAEREWSDPERAGWGTFAAAVDAPRRWLWTSVAATPTTRGYASQDSDRTGLTAWDLRTGRVVRRVEWPRDGRNRLLGDLTIAPDGTVYVSDSPGGAVRRLRPGADSMDTVVPDGGVEGPQTPALAADGKRLYVASYARGIAIVDLASRHLGWMSFAPGVAIQGIDGLYAYRGDLIAVQNGTRPHRVVRLALDPSGTRVRSATVIESGTHRLGEPTHGVVVGHTFHFLINTGWERVGDDQQLKPGAAEPPAILEADLGAR